MMNSNLLLCLLLLALTFGADAAEDANSETVVDKDCLYRSMNPPESAHPVQDYYNPKDLESVPDFLTNDKLDYPRVVEFYSPTCPHCQMFAGQYVHFAQHFVNLTTSTTASHYTSLKNVKFHAVSCLAHKTVCHQENIRNYPTIKVIPPNTASKDAILIQAHQLHPFKLAKILGAEAVPWPAGATQPAAVGNTKGGRTPRLRGKGKLATAARLGKGAASHERLELPKTTVVSTPATDSKAAAFPPPRTQQEMFNDAYLSFYMTMKNSVFMEAGPLSKPKQTILKTFIELLRDALPSWRIHSLFEKLLKDFVRITYHEKVWSMTLDTLPPPTMEWSPACQLHGNGYTCGLWTLFHIATVGIVEYNHANVLEGEELATFQDLPQIADTLKDFIATFFICEECTTHFVQEYDDCAFDRCKRLESTATNMTQWSQLPLWLLETHNAVNVRLHKKRTKQQLVPKEEEQSVMWPPLAECPACWKEANGATSQYQEDVMYKYLRVTYWPEDADAKVMRDEIRSLKASYTINRAMPTKTMVVEKKSAATTNKDAAATTKDTTRDMDQPTTKNMALPKPESGRKTEVVDDATAPLPPLELVGPSEEDIPGESAHGGTVFFSLVVLASIAVASKKKHLWQRKSWIEHTE